MRLLTCIMTLVLACCLDLQAKNYVVCVGLRDYPGTKNDLHLSEQDAQTIKEVYEKNRAQSENSQSEVVLITNNKANRNYVLETALSLFNMANEDDAIVFYFSGHGMPSGFVCYDGILEYMSVIESMTNSKASTKIIIADACFAGKARTEKQNATKEISQSNVLFFLSSRSNEESIERKTWKNSLFTAYLERGLRGGADMDRNRQITARELFTFVSNGVAKVSKDKQHPVMWGKFSDDMVVMDWTQNQ